MPDKRIETGRAAEDAVANHLISEGYEILERNYRRRIGEIDIIARKGSRIHFIEIKSRTTDTGPSLLESWSADQRRRFVKLAEGYLAGHAKYSKAGFEICFDFAAVTMDTKGSIVQTSFIEDAFRPE